MSIIRVHKSKTTEILDLSETLLGERPVIFQPSIAKVFGIEAAIVLEEIHSLTGPERDHIPGQQISYWNNHHWVRKPVIQWVQEFPFLSDSTIKRTISKLEKQGILISQKFEKSKGLHSKWYRINYPAFYAALPHA